MGTRRKFLESLIPTNFLPRLPSAYQEVEYLESTGEQYIDTGYSNKNANTNKYDLTFSVTSWTSSCGFYGAGNYEPDGHRTCMLWSNQSERLQISSGSTPSMHSEYSGIYSIGNKVTKVIYCDNINNKYSVDGNGNYNFAGSSKNENTIRIFYPSYESSAQAAKMRLYCFKIYEDNTLVRDFVPCYRKADGVAGLYDIVNGVFYTNAGTGTFICGRPVVSRVYQPVEYLESIVGGYIDTGVAGNNPQLSFDVKYSWSRLPGNNSYAYIYGNFAKEQSNCTRLLQYGNNTTYLNVDTVAGGGTSTYSAARSAGAIYHDIQSQSLYVTNNTSQQLDRTAQGNANTSTIKVFQNRTGDSQGDTRLYSFKIYDNHTLIRDFVPCYHIVDGVAGLLDKVHGVFYTNKGTGEFICGRPLIDPRYQRVEYIESTGEQYLNTGVLFDMDSKAKIYLDQQWLGPIFSLNAWSGTNGYSTIAYDTSNNTLRINAAVDIPDADRQRRLQFYVLTNVNEDKRQAIYQNTTYTGAATVTNYGYYWLFGLYDNNSEAYTTYRIKQKMFECKIWKDNVLVRSFIPCYRKSDGEIGLYDIVEGKFYTNSGTGTFLKGQNI